MRQIVDWCVILSLVVLAAACRGVAPEPQRPVVTVAIEPLRPLVQSIAGDRVQVRTLMAEGTDPETYDPTMASLTALERSRAYFAIGNMPFEDRILAMVQGSGIEIVDVTEGIDLIEGTHGHAHDADDDGHDHAYDPHTWSSVRNSRVMARNIVEALCRIDTAGATEFRQRAAVVDDSLRRVDSLWSVRLAPVSGGAFAVWHPSLSYFARDYGLRQIAIGAEGKEMSVRDMIRAIDRAEREGVNVIITQPGYDTRPVPLSDNVARHTRVLTFSPMTADWGAEMQVVVDSLARLLPRNHQQDSKK